MRINYAAGLVILACCAAFVQCEERRGPTPDPISVESSVPLTPPAVPTPAPVVQPKDVTPAPLPEFAIDGLTEIEPGRMLTLTITGITATAAIDGPLPGVSWLMYPKTDDQRIERNGHAIHATWPGPCHVWFVASVNNPDPTAKPLVAMKLVKVGEPKTPEPDTKPATPTTPSTPSTPVAPSPVKRVTYVYEKDDGEIPSEVAVALDRLNRDRKIMATKFEDDSTDGDDQVPEQYKAALAIAREFGEPILVIEFIDGRTPLYVKGPTTKEQVLQAVP